MMMNRTVIVAWTIDDLAGLPVGTRIATNTNKIMVLDEIPRGRYWIEPGTLEAYYQAMAAWLPAYILPSVMEKGPVTEP
jgi:hypothetical protein